MAQPLIAVTGATGHVGGLVAERLAAAGAEVRMVVREAASAPAITGADVFTASSYGATEEMTAALRGVDTLLLISAREAEDRLAEHYSAVDAAVAAGVSRVVYTSICGAAPDASFTLARDHHATEQAIVQSGLAWAIMRNNLYTDMLPRFADTDGIIRGPAGNGRLVPVTRSDVADVAVALLLDDSRDGQFLNVSGPQRVSLRHAANRMAAITGMQFEFQMESLKDAYASRQHFGAPEWQVEAWVSTYLAIAEGEFDVPSDLVEEITGRAPTSLERFLLDEPSCWEHVTRAA